MLRNLPHQLGHWFYIAPGPSWYMFAPVPGGWLPKMVRDLKVYFYLLAESVSWIIKVLSSLLETPQRKEITRTDLGLERKRDKECVVIVGNGFQTDICTWRVCKNINFMLWQLLLHQGWGNALGKPSVKASHSVSYSYAPSMRHHWELEFHKGEMS